MFDKAPLSPTVKLLEKLVERFELDRTVGFRRDRTIAGQSQDDAADPFKNLHDQSEGRLSFEANKAMLTEVES